MNVLSLFDGISCGQLAFARSGIKIDNYFASEIDEHAKAITQFHFKNTIQLGDVTKIKSVPSDIDILIGGSPCQGFSFAGNRLNFEDDRSKLFFKYVNLLENIKPKYFLLENVMMKKDYQNIISNYLGVAPIVINSDIVSKQSRKRLYWTNIPGVSKPEIISENYFNKWLFQIGHGYISPSIKFYKKYPTVTAQPPATKYRIITCEMNEDIAKSQTDFSKFKNNEYMLTRSATPEECEEFQTIPIGYTNKLKKTKRYHVIGNGWTVDVISHIFNYLKI